MRTIQIYIYIYIYIIIYIYIYIYILVSKLCETGPVKRRNTKIRPFGIRHNNYREHKLKLKTIDKLLILHVYIHKDIHAHRYA